MQHDISYYKKIQNALNSDSKKQTLLRVSTRQVDRDFRHSLNWERVTCGEDTFDLLITPGSSGQNKKIKTRPGGLIWLGQLLFWANTYWLVTGIDFDQQIHLAGEMEQCNTVLRWQDETKQILSTYAVAEDATKYSEGIQESQYMQTPYFIMKLRIPETEDTVKIERDKRFLLGNLSAPGTLVSYAVTRVNRITNSYDIAGQEIGKGYIELTLSEDLLRPEEDNLELGIADYQDPDEQPGGEGGWFG